MSPCKKFGQETQISPNHRPAAWDLFTREPNQRSYSLSFLTLAYFLVHFKLCYGYVLTFIFKYFYFFSYEISAYNVII